MYIYWRRYLSWFSQGTHNIWVMGDLFILKDKTLFLIYEEFSAQINKKMKKIRKVCKLKSWGIPEVQHQGEFPHLHTGCTVPAFLCYHIWRSSKEGEGKALWEGEASSSSKQSQGEKREKATFTCHCITTFSPLKLLFLVLKALTFIGHMLAYVTSLSRARLSVLNARKAWLFQIRFSHAIFAFTDVFSSETVVYCILGRIHIYIFSKKSLHSTQTQSIYGPLILISYCFH